MVSNNEIRDSLNLEENTAQKECELKQLAKEIQPNLDVFLCDDNEPSVELSDIDDSTFKQRRSKRLVELNKKYNIKTKRRIRRYLNNNKKVK